MQAQAQSPHPAAKLRATGVPAVERAIAVLDLLAGAREAMSLSQLASRLDCPKSSMHGLCGTLAARGYLRREGDGSFFIGPGVMGLANAFVARTTVAHEFAGLWQELDAPPDESIMLSVLDGSEVVYIAARQGELPFGLMLSVGTRFPAHLAASGQAMLAYHDEAFVRRLYPGGRLPRGLLAQLRRVRERGWSLDDENLREGVCSFGAAVFDASGQPVAGVGVCTHKAALNARSEARHRRMVVDVARRLTQRLGGTPRATGASR
jgi:IclR family transcriptional regulator, blcABC operon repressor